MAAAIQLRYNRGCRLDIHTFQSEVLLASYIKGEFEGDKEPNARAFPALTRHFIGCCLARAEFNRKNNASDIRSHSFSLPKSATLLPTPLTLHAVPLRLRRIPSNRAKPSCN